jgi:GAF domain-containing protein
MDEQRLAATFVELADTLVADFDVIEFLYVLTHRCTQVLEVSAAGVMLADSSGTLRLLAASDEHTELLELFQLQNDQGPCFECFHSGQPVAVADLSAVEDRWPRFAAEARAQGIAAVHALPMRLREETIGALNLFGTVPGAVLTDTRIAQALADVATIGILQQRAHSRAETVILQLQSALNTRVIIEQAKGVLAERTGTSIDDAFKALRDFSRAHSRRLSEVASAVVDNADDVAALTTRPVPAKRPGAR